MSETQRAGVILVVVDDPRLRECVCGSLEQGAYRIVETVSAQEAMDWIGRGGVEPTLAVVRLVEMNAEFLDDARGTVPGLGAVLMSDNNSVERLPRGGGEGVVLLGDLCDAAELLGAVEYLQRRRLGSMGEAPWRARIERTIAEQHAQMERRLEQFAVASLDVLVTALEARDSYMSGHSMRVAQLSASIADAMGRTEQEVESVRLAGRLHDIGMTAISEEVLNRRGPLTPAEYVQIRRHPLLGDQLLQPYVHLREVARFVRGHHERWDGHGYPDALAGEAIPWGARILGVAETYDALVTSRAYSERILSPAEARAELQAVAGTLLDPAVVEALAGSIRSRRTLEFVIPEDPDAVRERGPVLPGAAPSASIRRDLRLVEEEAMSGASPNVAVPSTRGGRGV